MNVGGPKGDQRAFGRTSHIGVNETEGEKTVLVKSISHNDVRVSWLDKVIDFISNPRGYLRQAKLTREMARDIPAHTKELRERKINYAQPSASFFAEEDLQTGLRKVNEQAEEYQGVDAQKQDLLLKKARAATGAPDPDAPLIPDLAYREQQNSLAQEYIDGIQQVKKESSGLRETYASLHSTDEKRQSLMANLDAKRQEVRLWQERLRTIPWYAHKESRIPPEFREEGSENQKPLTRVQMHRKLEKLASEFYEARDLLSEYNHAAAYKHDRDRYPAVVMGHVDSYLDKAMTAVEQDLTRELGLPEGAKLTETLVSLLDQKKFRTLYFSKINQYVQSFRTNTVIMVEEMQKRPKVLTDDHYQRYNARQLAGQALDRMMRMSKTREGFLLQLDAYKKGEPSNIESLVAERSGATKSTSFPEKLRQLLSVRRSKSPSNLKELAGVRQGSLTEYPDFGLPVSGVAVSGLVGAELAEKAEERGEEIGDSRVQPVSQESALEVGPEPALGAGDVGSSQLDDDFGEFVSPDDSQVHAAPQNNIRLTGANSDVSQADSKNGARYQGLGGLFSNPVQSGGTTQSTNPFADDLISKTFISTDINPVETELDNTAITSGKVHGSYSAMNSFGDVNAADDSELPRPMGEPNDDPFNVPDHLRPKRK